MHSKTPESQVDKRGLSIPLHEAEMQRGPDFSGPLCISARYALAGSACQHAQAFKPSLVSNASALQASLSAYCRSGLAQLRTRNRCQRRPGSTHVEALWDDWLKAADRREKAC